MNGVSTCFIFLILIFPWRSHEYAKLRIRFTWINRKEQSTLHPSQLLIQVLPANAGLHDNVHVVLVELDDAVHVGKVDADAAVGGGKVALEARAPGVGDDGDPVLVADPGYGRDLLRRPRVRHGHGQRALGVGAGPLRVPVRVQVVGVRGDDVFFVVLACCSCYGCDLMTNLL